MSTCLLYLAVIDGRTKIGITKDWSDRKSTFIRKGARKIKIVKSWELINRSTAISFEKLLLKVFSSYRIAKSEYITLSAEQAIPYVEHIFETLGYFKIIPPSNRKFITINLVPLLELALAKTLRKRNLKLIY